MSYFIAKHKKKVTRRVFQGDMFPRKGTPSGTTLQFITLEISTRDKFSRFYNHIKALFYIILLSTRKKRTRLLFFQSHAISELKYKIDNNIKLIYFIVPIIQNNRNKNQGQYF